MDGDEQVGLMLVGDGGARLQRNERVVVAGVDHVGAQARLQQPAQAQSDVEHQILLHHPVRADGAGVVAAVSGIDHNASDLQSQRRGQAAIARRGRLGFVRRKARSRWLRSCLFFFESLRARSHSHRSRSCGWLGGGLQLGAVGIARAREQRVGAASKPFARRVGELPSPNAAAR